MLLSSEFVYPLDAPTTTTSRNNKPCKNNGKIYGTRRKWILLFYPSIIRWGLGIYKNIRFGNNHFPFFFPFDLDFPADSIAIATLWSWLWPARISSKMLDFTVFFDVPLSISIPSCATRGLVKQSKKR
jgi:hypothetical protein